MLILAATTDKLQLITGSAATVDVHATHIDYSAASPPVPDQPERTNTAITTAATTDIVAAPGASKRRNVKTLHIRNKDATNPTDVTVVYNQNATTFEVHKANLAPGEALEYIEGIGFFEVASPAPVPVGTNFAAAATAAGFAADTYVVGSALNLAALGAPRVGRSYHWRLMISKTAAGTATPILIVRIGTAGTTADAAILTFTWGAGTAAIDRGEIELDVIFLTVGASATVRGKVNWTTNLSTTGLTNAVKALTVTSGTFNSGVANSIIGLSYNGGTSAAHTIEDVRAYTDNL